MFLWSWDKGLNFFSCWFFVNQNKEIGTKLIVIPFLRDANLLFFLNLVRG